MADLKAVRGRFFNFMRAHDFNGAAVFFAKEFQEAKASGDLDAAEIGDLYGSALMAGGRDLEALEVYKELLYNFPRDSYLNLRVATFLTTLLNRPSDALATLDPVLGELIEDSFVRHATLGIWGANHARLGNIEEARRSFELLREQDFSATDPSAIDFLLVEELVSRGEMLEQAREYLSQVLARARQTGEDGVASRADALLSELEKQS